MNIYPPYDELDKGHIEGLRDALTRLGLRCDNEHTKLLPYRLGHYLRYLLSDGKEPHVTVFPNDNCQDGLEIVPGITFWSACSHHALPFYGVALIGYIPDKHVLGLSKFTLLIRHLARGLWLQEELTEKIATIIEDAVRPFGVGVVTSAVHTCQLLDLQQPPIPPMIYSVMRGALRDDPAVRGELVALAGQYRG